MLLFIIIFFIIWTPFWFISVFETTAYLKFAKLQYVSSDFVAGPLQVAETT